MRLIFIRHAEPDYAHDSLTEKGWREAEYLGQRTQSWPIDHIYVSPLGRAQDTAKSTLAHHPMQPTVCPWLQEFYVTVPNPVTGRPSIGWDYLPDDWTAEPQLFDSLQWADAPRYDLGLPPGYPLRREDFESGAIPYQPKAVRAEWDKVCQGIDDILAEYGYHRRDRYYEVDETKDVTLLFFAHLGAIDAILSHVLNIAAPLLWQGMFLPPSSVTVLGAEERKPGLAYFRAQCYGDTAHLLMHGEPVSQSGYFTDPFSL